MDLPDRAIVAAYKAIRTAEQAQLEWDHSYATGEWELVARPPTGGIKVVVTEDRQPVEIQKQRTTFAYRVAAEPQKMYRGIKLNNLPPDLEEFIHRHLQMPYEESEVGQHLKIGPKLLDHIENNHWEKERGYEEPAHTGRHWTMNRNFAESAASPNTGPCRFQVLLEADVPTNPYATDPKHNGEHQVTMDSEQEITAWPGAPLNITGLKIKDGPEWREVLHDPEYIQHMAEYGLPYIGGPQVREAKVGKTIRLSAYSERLINKLQSEFNGWYQTHPHPITVDTTRGPI